MYYSHCLTVRDNSDASSNGLLFHLEHNVMCGNFQILLVSKQSKSANIVWKLLLLLGDFVSRPGPGDLPFMDPCDFRPSRSLDYSSQMKIPGAATGRVCLSMCVCEAVHHACIARHLYHPSRHHRRLLHADC